MSVRPVQFNVDGSIEVIYDEQGHSGTIPAAEVVWTLNMDGTHNHNFIVLNCPDGCGAASTWPVGGGADAINGQQMFVEKINHAGCACGNIDAGNANLADAHVHLNVARMEGDGRYAL